jgi:hypothetical protein
MEKRSLRPPKRSVRRHHKERLKKKRQFYWLGHEWPMDDRQLGLVVSTPAICNCWQCKNPRHVFKGKDKITIQEKKALLEDIDYMPL